VKIRIHAEAREELEAAAVWYDVEERGLGQELLEELSLALSTVAASPTTWPLVGTTGLRRLLLTRFPYSIIYDFTAEEIRVHAIGHLSRRPGYWRHRRFK
jgi:toxin ParE1/3/4